MTEEPYTICELCHERLHPDDPDAVPAETLVRTVAMGPTVEYAPGLRVLFHTDCFPEGDPGYRRI